MEMQKMNLKLAWRARACAAVAGLALASVANAQYILGPVTLSNNVPNLPGLGGESWVINGFNFYAGDFNWNGGSLTTICASLNQGFPANGVFDTQEYWLSGATATPSNSITLGDTTTVLPLPGIDVSSSGASGYSNANFMRAAEMFGALYYTQADIGNPTFSVQTTVQQNDSAAALQLALWATMYPSYSITITDANLLADYNADLATSVSTANLQNVDWYYYDGTEGGQSQFGYVASTPEPISLVALGGALVLGARRRRSRKN
jgi:hypothetical protein